MRTNMIAETGRPQPHFVEALRLRNTARTQSTPTRETLIGERIAWEARMRCAASTRISQPWVRTSSRLHVSPWQSASTSRGRAEPSVRVLRPIRHPPGVRARRSQLRFVKIPKCRLPPRHLPHPDSPAAPRKPAPGPEIACRSWSRLQAPPMVVIRSATLP
jgi:hypothetical protein